MIRLSLLWAFIAAIWFVSFRDRMLAVCSLILLSVVSQHPDVPSNIFGIPGLNPWNLAFLGVIVGWFAHPRLPLPPTPMIMKVLVGAYILVLLGGAAAALLDAGKFVDRMQYLVRGGFPVEFGDLVKDLIINPLKYVMLGVLFYCACQTRRQAWMGVLTVCAVGVAYSGLMYKAIGLRIFTGDYEDARRWTSKLIGLHANDLAGLLTMTLWALIVVGLLRRDWLRWWAFAGAAFVLPCMVGCQSRAAYIANIGVACALAAVRFRWMFLGFPVLLAVVLIAFPRIAERMGMGFDSAVSQFDVSTDWNEVTAGRTSAIWEPVLHQIPRSPIFGFGRLAIGRGDATFEIIRREGWVPTHPHNSYLELMLDSGVLGLGVVMALLGALLYMSLQLFHDRADVLLQLVGGIGFVAVVNVAVLGLASSFFYPKESSMWLLGAAAMVTRCWSIQRARRATGPRIAVAPEYAGGAYPAPSYGAASY